MIMIVTIYKLIPAWTCGIRKIGAWECWLSLSLSMFTTLGKTLFVLEIDIYCPNLGKRTKINICFHDTLGVFQCKGFPYHPFPMAFTNIRWDRAKKSLKRSMEKSCKKLIPCAKYVSQMFLFTDSFDKFMMCHKNIYSYFYFYLNKQTNKQTTK